MSKDEMKKFSESGPGVGGRQNAGAAQTGSSTMGVGMGGGVAG